MVKLSDDEVTRGLAGLEGWQREGSAIASEFRLPDFGAAVAFVVRLSYKAEAADHHPDLDIRYNRVRVVLSTHSEGGVTDKDLDLARTIQELAPEG